MVSITLDSAGGRSMLETTKEYLQHRMAVVFIENKVETILKDGETIKTRSKHKILLMRQPFRVFFPIDSI